METYKLRTPKLFDDVERKEIQLDLEGLTGEDIISAERQFLASGNNDANPLKEFAKEYQILLAARAAKLPVEFFHSLSAKDFTAITIKVQNFLLE